MKRVILGITAVIMMTTTLHAQTKPKKPVAKPKPKAAPVFVLKNAADSFSYALGANVANNLLQQGVSEVQGPAMQRAMEDVFGNKKTLMNEEQCNTSVQKKFQEYMSKQAEMERIKSKAFLDENSKRPGVITLPSGLQYEVLKKSDTGTITPKITDTIVAHYAGSLADGTEFDNSYKRGEPLTIGVGNLIKGWTEALQLMHIGDKWKLYIPSEIGYGDRGNGDIPGGAALIFEMELLGIKPAAKP